MHVLCVVRSYIYPHYSAIMESHLSSPRTLLVRHFPDWLNREEKESLLRHFGAQDVVIMGLKGKMVHLLAMWLYLLYSCIVKS